MKIRIQALLLIVMLGATATASLGQTRDAPDINGMAVQGVTVNLDYYQGDKNVLVVFYRMHD